MVLQLIGTLPQLDSLTIEGPIANPYAESEDELYLDGLVLPPESFPYPNCGATSPLFGNSCTSMLRLNYSHHVPTDSEVDNTARDICKNSPHVIELYQDTLGLIYDFSSVTIESLRKLPSLQRLELPGTGAPESLDDFRLFISSAVNLEYLALGFGFAKFEDLMLFAKHMPKLRFLSWGVILSDWPTNLEPEAVSPSPSTLCLRSGYQFSEDFGEDELDEDQVMEEHIDTIARNLLTLWPKGVNCEGELPAIPARTSLDDEYLALLNDTIRSL
ncbi:hypothetical protein FRC07_012291, partial [Ceratobasidium sp. 392]